MKDAIRAILHYAGIVNRAIMDDNKTVQVWVPSTSLNNAMCALNHVGYHTHIHEGSLLIVQR